MIYAKKAIWLHVAAIYRFYIHDILSICMQIANFVLALGTVIDINRNIDIIPLQNFIIHTLLKITSINIFKSFAILY